MGVYCIKRLRQEMNINSEWKQKFKATTNSSHKLPVAENLLNQIFSAKWPNEARARISPGVHTTKGGFTSPGEDDFVIWCRRRFESSCAVYGNHFLADEGECLANFKGS